MLYNRRQMALHTRACAWHGGYGSLAVAPEFMFVAILQHGPPLTPNTLRQPRDGVPNDVIVFGQSVGQRSGWRLGQRERIFLVTVRCGNGPRLSQFLVPFGLAPD
jgi:hypothetical protein